MIVSEKFPDIFLRYEDDKVVFRIRVLGHPLVSKKYGKKWQLHFSRYSKNSDGTDRWDTIYGYDNDDFWDHDNPYFEAPWFFGRKAFFERTMIEEYEIIKAHADRIYDEILENRRVESKRDQSQREAFNNLVSEIEGELKE